MIPTVEDILRQLAEKQISIEQAQAWINMHLQSAADTSASRGYFAGEALNAMLSKPKASQMNPQDMATGCVQMADALIAELNKGE